MPTSFKPHLKEDFPDDITMTRGLFFWKAPQKTFYNCFNRGSTPHHARWSAPLTLIKPKARTYKLLVKYIFDSGANANCMDFLP